MDRTLPYIMDVFAPAYYNTYIVTIGGHRSGPGHPLNTTKALINSSYIFEWEYINNLNTEPFVQNIQTSDIQYLGQGSVQIDNLVFGLPHFDNINGDYLLIYNLSLNQYHKLSNYNYTLPLSASQPCICNVNLFLYIIGGQNKKTLQIYDIVSDQWIINKSSLNKNRNLGGCSANDPYVFILGGYGAGNALDSIEKYDIINDIWLTLNTTLVVAGYYHQCLYIEDVNQYIYCAGGRNPIFSETYSATRLMEVFDTKNDEIVTHDFNVTLQIPRDALMLNIDNQYLLIMGGYNGKHLQSIEKWTVIEAPTLSPTINPTMTMTTNKPSNSPLDDISTTLSTNLEGIAQETPHNRSNNIQISNTNNNKQLPLWVYVAIIVICCCVTLCITVYVLKRKHHKDKFPVIPANQMVQIPNHSFSEFAQNMPYSKVNNHNELEQDIDIIDGSSEDLYDNRLNHTEGVNSPNNQNGKHSSDDMYFNENPIRDATTTSETKQNKGENETVFL
eukprot:515801_1